MKNQELSMFGERAFDAVLTVAHALNKSIIKLKENNLTLENFSFLDEWNISNLFADIISDEIRSIEVQGLTVSVYIYMHCESTVCMQPYVYIP